jgi:DNA-binding FrmR family transcriptional regulator
MSRSPMLDVPSGASSAPPPSRQDAHRAAIDAGLARVEGQCRGLRRMVEERRGCEEILQQLVAARNALDRIGCDLLVCNLEGALEGEPLTEAGRRRVEVAIGTVMRLR